MNGVEEETQAEGVRVRALYDYMGQEDDELTFKAGKRFLMLRERAGPCWPVVSIRDERGHHSTAADRRQELPVKLATGEFKLCNVSHRRAQVFCLERKLVLAGEHRPHMEGYPSELDPHFSFSISCVNVGI